MEECAIPANHDFVPMDVGNSEPDRARVEIAHDETREQPRPGLHQEAQIVLGYGRSTDLALPASGSRRSLSVRQSVTLQVPGP